jgi:pimeloyl-ACP methyl ester carboxylesterase
MVMILFAVASCVGPSTQASKSNSLTTASVATQYGTIHYAYSTPQNQPKNQTGILFLHGTPGDHTAFQDYLTHPQLSKKFVMLAIDRYGWGETNITNKQNDYSFAQQSEAALTAMEQFKVDNWIIVGHSYGASLAGDVAIEHNAKSSNKVTSLVLIAGSLDPKLGNPRWYNRLANFRLINWALPGALKKANEEIMRLNQELNLLNAKIQQVGLPETVVLIQGMKDKLVSPKNADFAQSNWSRHTQLEVIKLDEVGHFIPWEESQTVIDTLESLHLRHNG